MNKSTIFMVILICIPLVNLCYSAEGSFSVCNTQSYSISSDESLPYIYLPCSGDAQSLFLNVVNPSTLQTIKNYQFNGLIQDIYAVDSGLKLLITLSELDGNPDTEEGMLIEVDYSTGYTLRSLYFDRSPEVMIIDPQESYAFVSIGLMDPYHPMDLLKVSLQSFQIVDEIVFGDLTDDMEITPDGCKIYIQSRNIYPGVTPNSKRWGVAAYDTCDLSRVASIELESPANLMEMSDDGSRLYIGSYYYSDDNTGVGLYIVDTQTDQVIESLMFESSGENVGTYSLAYDGSTDSLYCTAQKDGDALYPFSNLIMQLDLTDYSYSFFTMGDNPLSRISLVQLQNSPRLFAVEEGTPVVHYKDLP